MPSVSTFSIDDLDRIVTEIDANGGPGAPDFWQRFGSLRYKPTIKIDNAIDPFSENYFDAMICIYEEISGRKYNPSVTELTDFDLEAHIAGPSSYGAHTAPSDIAMHFHRLSSAIRLAHLPVGASVLDMGCGWGLSSEFLAQCGFLVNAVDINPKFVDLVEKRARKLGYSLSVTLSSFDDFKPDKLYNGVLFYECLHHATRPWTLIERLATSLTDEGKFILAGEPIQDEFWPHWGIRLDPLSIYCVRKFGWFESGWSLEFLKRMFARAGMMVRVKTDPDPVIGMIVCAEKWSGSLSAADLLAYINQDEWIFDGTNLICKGKAFIELIPPSWARTSILKIFNYRGRPVPFKAMVAGQLVFDSDLVCGENLVRIKLPAGATGIELTGESWSPARELGSNDSRTLSFHLSEIEFQRELAKEQQGDVTYGGAKLNWRRYTLSGAHRYLNRKIAHWWQSKT